MLLTKAKNEDLQQLKQLYNKIFDDGTHGYCDFAFSLCSIDNVYIVKDNETVASMLMAIDVTINSKKGFYLYSACTDERYRKKGYMKALINFAYINRIENGDEFCILQPADESLFSFYEKLGFTTKTYLRNFDIDIADNMWATAEFDTLTASKLQQVREKYIEQSYVSFPKKGYENFAYYIYSFSGSTAEDENGYCIYYHSDETITIRELCSKDNTTAIKLIQAIKGRTKATKVKISLNDESLLFLGYGKKKAHCLIKGLNENVYANLMFD